MTNAAIASTTTPARSMGAMSCLPLFSMVYRRLSWSLQIMVLMLAAGLKPVLKMICSPFEIPP